MKSWIIALQQFGKIHRVKGSKLKPVSSDRILGFQKSWRTCVCKSVAPVEWTQQL